MEANQGDIQPSTQMSQEEAPQQEQPQRENVTEAGEVPQEEKKVTFDEHPQEIPSEQPPTTAATEEQKAKKKGFLGNWFSRHKGEQPQAGGAAGEQPGETSPAAEEVGAAGAAAGAAAGQPSEEGQQEAQQPAEAGHEEKAPEETPSGEEQAQSESQHTGVLYKPGLYFKSHIKKRHFRLVPGGQLQYSRIDTFRRTKTIQLSKGTKVEAKDLEDKKDPHPHMLYLTMPDNIIYSLRADSAEERDAWASDIQETLKELEGGETGEASQEGQEPEVSAPEEEQLPSSSEPQQEGSPKPSPIGSQSPQPEKDQPELQGSNEVPQAAAS